jgi:hypothetical protein
MKIVTNNIGNYTLGNIKASTATAQSARAEKMADKTPSISNTEKEFFSKMYPTKRDEIINYHFYSRTGEKSGVAVGKNIDRRM